ncbi:hypothetical protein O3P69_017557 [Scylla paramamosain]|uniref:Uncharacterized protein n=1 Tax=Scylla paramamosain TaxID=85552 RepID=A0AAW0TXU8_SCYPA
MSPRQHYQVRSGVFNALDCEVRCGFVLLSPDSVKCCCYLLVRVKVTDYLGRVDEFPVVRRYLRCPFYTGWTDVMRAPIKFAIPLVKNIPGVNDPR